MGAYLSHPSTDKESEDGGNLLSDTTRFGVTSMQGWRQSMEDAHIACPKFSKGGAVYGVFDGHGGHAVSAWVSRHFVSVLEETMTTLGRDAGSKDTAELLTNDPEFVKQALAKTFLAIDTKLRSQEARDELKTLHEEIAARNNQGEGGSDGEDEQPMMSTSMLQQMLKQGGAGGEIPGGLKIHIVGEDGQERVVPIMSEDFEASSDDGEEDADSSKQKKIEEVRDDEDPTAASSSTETANSTAKKNDKSATSAPSKGAVTSDAVAPLPDGKQTDAVAAASGANASGDGKGEASVDRPADDKDVGEDGVEDEDMSDARGARGKEENQGFDDIADMVGPDMSDPDTPALLSPYTPEGCGATAVVAFVTSGTPRRLVVANAGDSRCVLSREGKAVEMSFDHKPCLESESDRIEKAGGHIVNGRVEGNLNLTRSLGDLFYKRDETIPPEEQKITANPDVKIVELDDKDEFAILACDGIWDCLTSQECVDFVRQCLFSHGLTSGEAQEPVLSKICEEVCDACLAKDPWQSEGAGCDNMTMMICQLGALSVMMKHQPPPKDRPQAHNVAADAANEDDD